MNGGISQMDSFLYRPELQKRGGQKEAGKNLFASPFAFAQHGQCGRWISSVFPHHARKIDKMPFLLGMHTDSNIPSTSSYMMNTGFMRAGFPCLGAWVSYALGQPSENLPAFVVLPDKVSMPYNGEGNFTSGFLSPNPSGHLGECRRTHPECRSLCQSPPPLRQPRVRARRTRPARLQLFDWLEKFAGYGFNKSHAAAYAMVAYQTAYLKANYLDAFFDAQGEEWDTLIRNRLSCPIPRLGSRCSLVATNAA